MIVITHESKARPTRSPHPHTSRQFAATKPAARPRQLRFATAVAGLITVTGLLAGCGTQVAPSGAKAGGAKTAKVSLTVSIVHGTVSGPAHWTLHCAPAGGTAPDPAAACKALFGLRAPFSPVKKVMMCPMIMVSAEQIQITGTWYGKKVHRVITDGGCDLSVFNRLHKTFY
jgi:hypothetical protein